MKKKLAMFLTAILTVSALSGCGTKAEVKPVTPASSTEPVASAENKDAPVVEKELSGKLKIWSFTNEMNTFALDFKRKNPKVEIEYTMVPMTNGEYQTKLQQALATGSDVPDVAVLEIAFLRQYIESDFLKDISVLKSKAEELKTYDFTVQAGTNKDGEVKAFSYQATPGALFYRRSLAKEYFGTDDPIEMQKLLGDFTKYKEAAKVIKEKSAGNTYIVGSPGDFKRVFFSSRTSPWVVDNKLVIDPKVEELWEVAKEFRKEGYEAQTTAWQEGWFAGMSGSLKDAGGNPKQVFSYFLPTWGLPYVLMQNAKTDTSDTSGDWGVIPGPMPYQWGGTWLSVTKDAENPELAQAFVEFCTLNEESLTNWATGVYTNEYLLAIDPSVGTLAQGPGDFVSSQVVVDKIKGSFSNSDTSKFVAGQNSYEEFAKVAPSISLKLIQGTDDAIERAMDDALNSYISSDISKEDAMKAFKDAVKTIIPDLDVN